FAMTRANSLGPDAWGALIAPKLADAETMQAGLAALIESDLAALSAWPRDLPQGIIHADLFPDNALFLGDALHGVIDFYFACNDALAYDLAVSINSWCFDGREYNITKGANLIAGYESVRKLSEAERAALPMLARGAAMRFFGTRLADWAATPAGALVRPKDPLEYADKLAFHRRARGAQDYGG
ncbi:MAG: phosphotransferase, partial [Hyphomonadaceae bacterium]